VFNTTINVLSSLMKRKWCIYTVALKSYILLLVESRGLEGPTTTGSSRLVLLIVLSRQGYWGVGPTTCTGTMVGLAYRTTGSRTLGVGPTTGCR